MRPDEHATYRGRETTFTVLGQTWRVSRAEVDRWDEFLEWAGTVLPDPLEEAEKQIEKLAGREYDLRQRKDVPDDAKARQLHFLQGQQDRLLRVAMDKACSYLALNSPEVNSLVRSPRGGAQLLYTLLREHQPGIDLDTCWHIMVNISADEFNRVLAVTTGKAPKQPAPLTPGAGMPPEVTPDGRIIPKGGSGTAPAKEGHYVGNPLAPVS